MKKIALFAFCVATLAASAGWEKVGSVEVAGTARVTAAIAQLAKLTGNEMAGGMATAAFMQSEVIQFFGPTRTGRCVLIPLYIDGTQLAADPNVALDGLEFAVLYPVIATKAKFLKHHTDAVETNGFIEVAGGYVKFSADGQWAAYSDKKIQVDLALAEATASRRPLGEDLTRLTFDARGMDVIRRAVEAAAQCPTNGVPRKLRETLRCLSGCSISVRVGENGLDFGLLLKTVPGTELDKVGRRTLGSDPMAFAGQNALYAVSSAADFYGKDSAVLYRKILGILKKQNLEMPFLTCVTNGALTAFTVDVSAFGRYGRGEETNALAKARMADLLKDVRAAVDEDGPLKVSGPARQVTVSLKGARMRYSPAERFAATLPEVLSKDPCQVSVTSLLAFFRAILPEILKLGPKEEAATVRPLLMLIPPEAKGGVASALWRERDELRGVMRISADEFKGVAAALTAVSAYFAAKKADEGDHEGFEGDSDEVDDDATGDAGGSGHAD